MAKVKIYGVNIALVRGVAMVQAGMEYSDKDRARRVFDTLVNVSKDGTGPGLQTFIHDRGVTAFNPSEVATLAFYEREEEPPQNDFGGPVPAYVPNPTPAEKLRVVESGEGSAALPGLGG